MVSMPCPGCTQAVQCRRFRPNTCDKCGGKIFAPLPGASLSCFPGPSDPLTDRTIYGGVTAISYLLYLYAIVFFTSMAIALIVGR